jgi:mannose-6-phosphate isomerase-like protein (cupin superfamily)
MSYENNVVKKPWGHEYLVYENNHVGLWFLNIESGQSTSMHCHPNKTTGLMVISGEAEVSFLSDKMSLTSSEKVMIRKGLFHSTRAPTGNLQIFEIETPVNKHDLVRLEDSYGRTGQPYEDSTKEEPKARECVWIEDPKANTSKKYRFGTQVITVCSVTSLDDLKKLSKKSSSGLMFLKGGLFTDYDIPVASPGDIVANDVLEKLMQTFHKVNHNTVILTHG